MDSNSRMYGLDNLSDIVEDGFHILGRILPPKVCGICLSLRGPTERLLQPNRFKRPISGTDKGILFSTSLFETGICRFRRPDFSAQTA
ncbi:hypothetical protein CEXT_598861 [Caerostris extrusa]|uniref:Uncharacterized protein n=1 Tax=Caerostris extrusa TaxID=172846 RepID=A0AAV4UXM2_CAEEX|nr:hypothetical protein CEXT_598861 [Caerostris extrusa]